MSSAQQANRSESRTFADSEARRISRHRNADAEQLQPLRLRQPATEEPRHQQRPQQLRQPPRRKLKAEEYERQYRDYRL